MSPLDGYAMKLNVVQAWICCDFSTHGAAPRFVMLYGNGVRDELRKVEGTSTTPPFKIRRSVVEIAQDEINLDGSHPDGLVIGADFLQMQSLFRLWDTFKPFEQRLDMCTVMAVCIDVGIVCGVHGFGGGIVQNARL